MNKSTNRIIMHIDMNSYFATVEQQANPLLRGKPVGVCAYLSERGCIIAASIEAKQRGVKTAMRVQDARKLCPDIILVENEPAKYRTISDKLFSLFAEYTDYVSPYSIDEAFLDLTGWQKDFGTAAELGKTIKKRIREEIGDWLKCSVGISYTQWLSKFASEEYKPDGLFVVAPDDIKKLFQDRPLQHACGIGPRMEKRIRTLGIHTLGQLQSSNPQTLLTAFGKYGYYMWAHVNGIEIPGWTREEQHEPKSIGHSYCVPKRGKDKEYLQEVLYKLCERAGRRLRRKERIATTIHSGFRYTHGGGLWKRRTVSYPLFTTRDIWEEGKKVIADATFEDTVSMIAVSVGGLRPFVPQLSFIRNDIKSYKLNKALDAINDQYGEYVVYPGIMYGLEKQAHDRIGFRKTVDVRRGEI
ncbi:MAG: DNA polymerase Y family protein [Patescibacteria group bacterium]